MMQAPASYFELFQASHDAAAAVVDAAAAEMHRSGRSLSTECSRFIGAYFRPSAGEAARRRPLSFSPPGVIA